MVGCVGDIPRRGEQQQAIALEVLDDLGIARELELLNIEVLLIILNPANVLIRQVLADDLDVILVLQSVLEHLKQGYNGDLTSRQAGSVGGQMVKKMIESYEQNMANQG